MDRLVERIFENVFSGKIDKNVGAELLEIIKNKKIDQYKEVDKHKEIAVIGIALKMPFAENIDEWWEVIKNGKDCITEIPKCRKEDNDRYILYTGKDKNMEYSPIAYLNEVDKFDHKFFRISPREAGLMGPTQRMFLQTAWEAIEDAGYGGNKLCGTRTGVYLGFCGDEIYDYKKFISEIEPNVISMALPGNLTSIIASRISYYLDLKGPAMAIDTACSSSLVAVHLACQAIKTGDCDFAIAGGIRLNLLRPKDLLDTGMESSNYRTRTFDDSSDGTGTGEGLAAVLLKPLDKAIEDKDNIYAIVKGSAVNHDGTASSIVAPNVLSQEEVIIRAWKDAGINPETISYIEAHGTGTRIGDPIEIDAITRAFKKYTNKKQFCAIGTVKSNIGHLDQSAGIAAFVKAVLTLKNKEIPPIVHFNRPNRNIKFHASPVYVSDTWKKWESSDYPRRCGVSSFGLSGTNCHVILEEAKDYIKNDVKQETNKINILTLSVKSENALKDLVLKYKSFKEKLKTYNIEDICYTANTGRGHYNYRIAILFNNIEELEEKIEKLSKIKFDEISNEDGIYFNKHKKVAFKNKIGEISEEEIRGLSKEANQKIDEFKYDTNNHESIVHAICELYVSGADINWESLYKNEKRKVRLPKYPFERTRCWIDIPECKELEVNNLFYKISWEKCAQEEKSEIVDNGNILILGSEKNLAKNIADLYRNSNISIIEVEMGTCFSKVNDNKFTISEKESDYDKLLEAIKEKNIRKILHLFTLEDRGEIYSVEEMEKNQNKGVYSLLYLTKAILRNQIKDDIEIILISNYVNSISSSEKILYPENATLFGLAKVIGKEYFKLKCRCLDIDEYTSAESLFKEVNSENSYFQVAYRENDKYVEILEKINIDKCEKDELKVNLDGVYVITGGTGAIGLEVAKYLAAKNAVNIALINRSEFPKREEWDVILDENKDINLCSKIRKILDIEKMGAKVECLSSNVASFDQMKGTFDILRNKYNKISGIIHCAGIGGSGFLANKDEKIFRNVMEPKVNGTWIINKLTENDKLDFFVMFSSATSVFGGPGESDYTAASSYLDAFCGYKNKNSTKKVTINWTAWKEIGMAKEFGVAFDTNFMALTTTKGMNAFSQVMDMNLSRVFIGEINYEDEEIKKAAYNNNKLPLGLKLNEDIVKDILSNRESQVEEKNSMNKHAMVTLRGRVDNIYTDTEKKIAQIWSEVLAVPEIIIYDNFFELGGDSLIAMKIMNRINKQMNLQVEVTELLIYTTIEQFSIHLDNNYLNKMRENYRTMVIEKADIQQFYPLSSVQKRMFILYKLDPNGISYNIPAVLECEGELDRFKFEKIFKLIIERHEIFRTSFDIIDGQYVQKIHDSIDFKVKYIESENIDDLILDFIKPFQLDKTPLLRVGLVKSNNNKSFMFIDMHHIVSDGISMNVLIQDFITLYEGKQLPNLKIQYKDYAVWQNNLLNKDFMKKQEEYWCSIFRNEIPVINMKLDYQRPVIKSYEGNEVKYSFDEALSTQLKGIALKEETTLYTVLMTIYNILLWKYTGQNDIVVGSAISGRKMKEFENMMGVFINTIALRNHPSGNKTFKQFLSEVKENSIKAFKNQDYQFDDLVSKINVRRDPSRNPIFDVMLTMKNMELPEMQVENLKFTPFRFNNKKADVDLHLSIFEHENQIHVDSLYCIRLFKMETIKLLMEHYESICRRVVENENIKLSEIELFSKENKNNEFTKHMKNIKETMEIDNKNEDMTSMAEFDFM